MGIYDLCSFMDVSNLHDFVSAMVGKGQVGGWSLLWNHGRVAFILANWAAETRRLQEDRSSLFSGAPHLISMPSFGL